MSPTSIPCTFFIVWITSCPVTSRSPIKYDNTKLVVLDRQPNRKSTDEVNKESTYDE